MDRAQTTRPDVAAASLLQMLRGGSWRWQRAMAVIIVMHGVTAFLTIWLLVILLDAWRALPVTAMVAAVALLGLCALAIALVMLWQLLRRPASGKVAARWDLHRGDEAQRLLIASQLASGQSIGSGLLADAAMTRALADLQTRDAPLPARQMRSAGATLMTVLACALLIGMIMPGDMLATTRRMFAPLLDLPTFTLAQFTVTATPDQPIASKPWTVDARVEHPTEEVTKAWLELDDRGQRRLISMLRLRDKQGNVTFRAMFPVPPGAERYRIVTPQGASEWWPMPPVQTAPPTTRATPGEIASAQQAHSSALSQLDQAMSQLEAALRDAETGRLTADQLQAAMEAAGASAAAAMEAMQSNPNVDAAAAQRLADAMAALQNATSQGGATAADSLAAAHEALAEMRDAMQQTPPPSEDPGQDGNMGQGQGTRSASEGASGGDGTQQPYDVPPMSEGNLDDSTSLTTRDGSTADVDLHAVPPIFRDAAARYFKALENEPQP